MIKTVFNKIKNWRNIALIALFLMLALSTQALATGVAIRVLEPVGGPGGTIYNNTGATALPDNYLVQIINVGTNGTIDPPNSGNTHFIGGDDVWIADVHIGDGTGDVAGSLYSSQGSIGGATIYLRAWEGTTHTNTTRWGNSATQAVPGAPNPPINWDVASFSTDQNWAVPQPTITRNPTSLSPSCTEGQNASNQTFNVGNSGSATLNYTISDNATWLSVSPGNGSIAQGGNAITHTVSYTTSGLAAGTHNATITITDANATNNPQTIPVTLTVTGVGQPTVTGINPNNGDQGQTLNVTISGSNTSWSGDMSGSVQFSGTGITINSATASNATTIAANISIAASAATGARTVTVTGCQGSATFTVNQQGGGSLTVTPAEAYIGQTIVVTGSGIPATVGTITVGGATANPTAWDAGSITCAVPPGATSGDVVVNGTENGSFTLQTGGVVIDDFEGGSVGTWATGLAQSGYYAFGQGITPDNSTITQDGPQGAARYAGQKGMQVTYSYAGDWGGGWGGTLSNTLDLSAYQEVSFFIKWDGSANSFKIGLKDIDGTVYSATVSNAELVPYVSYGSIQKSAFTHDIDGSEGGSNSSLEWNQITDYSFTYTSQSQSTAPHYVDCIFAGNVIWDPEIPTQEGDVIIDHVDPTAGPAGTKFTAYGSGFGAAQGQSILVFENLDTHTTYQCEVLSWSDTEIEAIVPRLAPAGNYIAKVIKLTVTQGTIQAFESNPAAFRITSGSPPPGSARIYPNPFNPLETTIPVSRTSGLSGNQVTIAYDATGVTDVGIYIYDATARLVYREVVTDSQITWDGKDNSGNYVADGLYLLRIVNEDNKSLIAKGKILVIKQ